MLRLENIRVRNILLEVNLSVAKNEFVSIMGDNGSGKTTLLNVISGVVKPDAGKIVIDSEDVTNISQHERASVVSNVFQDPKVGTIGNMTIRENLNIAYMRGKSRLFCKSNSRIRDDLYVEKLKILRMNIENRLDDYVHQLSGGQRQALSVVMAVISDSKLLLLDEITAALDHKSSENILEIIGEIIRIEKMTCIMITHNVNHVNQLGSSLFVLENGKLAQSN
jgi:putative ABC transport system ATP-binding protein